MGSVCVSSILKREEEAEQEEEGERGGRGGSSLLYKKIQLTFKRAINAPPPPFPPAPPLSSPSFKDFINSQFVLLLFSSLSAPVEIWVDGGPGLEAPAPPGQSQMIILRDTALGSRGRVRPVG